MGDIPVICQTAGRAGRVSTIAAVRPLILCVQEDEYAEYKEAYPDAEFLVHPTTVVGLGQKDRWVHEQVGDMFLVHDDFTALVQTYDAEIPSREQPERAYEIIQQLAVNARQFNVFLFGFANSHDARYYDANRPIRLAGYINSATYGLFKGSRITFPDDPTCAVMDFIYSGLNAYYHRMIYVDTRWGFQQTETFKNVGGLSKFRTNATEEYWTKEMRKMFGDAVQIKVKASSAGEGSGAFERTMRIPWV